MTVEIQRDRQTSEVKQENGDLKNKDNHYFETIEERFSPCSLICRITIGHCKYYR